MKMYVFWVIVSCSMVKFTDVSKVFVATTIRTIVMIMKAESTSKTLINFTTLHGSKPRRQPSLLS